MVRGLGIFSDTCELEIQADMFCRNVTGSGAQSGGIGALGALLQGLKHLGDSRGK